MPEFINRVDGLLIDVAPLEGHFNKGYFASAVEFVVDLLLKFPLHVVWNAHFIYDHEDILEMLID